ETGVRMFATERISSHLDVIGLNAAQVVAAIDAYVEVEKSVLDLLGGRDEYSRESARLSISMHVCETPFFCLSRLIESLRARGVPSEGVEVLQARIVPGIQAAEHGHSIHHAAEHDLAIVDAEYSAWRSRFLETSTGIRATVSAHP